MSVPSNAHAYIDGHPAKVLSYDQELGRVVEVPTRRGPLSGFGDYTPVTLGSGTVARSNRKDLRARVEGVWHDFAPGGGWVIEDAELERFVASMCDALCSEPDPSLSDPAAVHVNMLRGMIAKPRVESIIHLYGAEALRAALGDASPHGSTYTPPWRQLLDEAVALLKASPDAGNLGTDLYQWLASTEHVRASADANRSAGPDIAALMRAATDHPLFVHDWSDPAVSKNPGPQDVSLSFVTPDHIGAAYMGLGIHGTIPQALADADALAALWNGWRSGLIVLASDFDSLCTLYTEACATIWHQAVEIERQAAIITDKVAETRLVQAGPSRDGFCFDFRDGPIPYIAEYLVQMLGFRDPDTPTANYAEIEVHHHEVGAMTLTLQRRSGDTPHQIAAKALRTAREAQAKLADEPTDAEVEAACEAGWEELRSLIRSDPTQGFEIGPWSAVPASHAAKGRAETRAALAAFLAKRRG